MRYSIGKTIRCFLIYLSAVLVSTGCTSTPGTAPQQLHASSGATTAFVQADALLHQRLQAVLEADNAYAQLATQAAPTTSLDSQNEAITTAEIALQQSIDSLEQTTKKDSLSGQLQQTIRYFKNALQSRTALSDLRMVLSANSDDSTAMQQSLAQLRTELQEKNKKITDLERTRNTSPGEPAGRTNINDAELKTYAPAKGETLDELRQRNKNLSLAYSDLQNKYFMVGRNYLLLKQEHERTLTELAALRKGGNQK
jgi:hypothetical protein